MGNSKSGDDTLRRKAEERLRSQKDLPDDISPEDANELIHELRVHQIELEMQNDELRRSQVQLDESRARYADLYDFAPVGYLTFDREGLVIEANLTAAKQLGMAIDRILEKSFSLYVPDTDRDAFHLHLAKVFKTGEPQTCEVRLRAMGGEEFYARLESIPVETADGRRMCRTSIIDISHAKLAEQELQRAHDELEKRVGDRTAELAGANELLKQEIAERKCAEENLKTSMGKLEQSSRELQDFAFSASHDMQEPVRKIQTFGNMLNKKSAWILDDQGRDYLERMLNSARRMSAMVSGLLAYSQVYTGEEHSTPVELTGVAQEAADSMRRLVRDVDATFEIGNLPILDADPDQMLLLLKNLIENAIKFRSEKKPLIRIYAKNVDDPERSGIRAGEQYVDIFVEDNGIGFEERYIDRIFSLFRRLHGRNAYQGTGMGLPVCRRIVERHNGTITATSTPGKGTTFIITLPSKKAE